VSNPVRVTCPCCGATLAVDGTSGEVLSHESPKSAPKSFDQALGEVHAGGKRREQAFSKAFDRTRKLEDLLDKKFEEARKKAEHDSTPPRNPFDSD
jgi:hypothetical protein